MDRVSAVSRALGQVLVQAEPQFPYLDHEGIDVPLEVPGLLLSWGVGREGTV